MIILLILIVWYALIVTLPWLLTYGPFGTPDPYLKRAPWNWRCLLIVPGPYSRWVRSLPENKIQVGDSFHLVRRGR
jgi:hypothetical protein